MFRYSKKVRRSENLSLKRKKRSITPRSRRSDAFKSVEGVARDGGPPVHIFEVYLGNLPYGVTKEDVKKLCPQGEVVSVSTRGHAFVRFEEGECAAFLEKKMEVGGRRVVVQLKGESAKLRLPFGIKTSTINDNDRHLRGELPDGCLVAPLEPSSSRKAAKEDVANEILKFIQGPSQEKDEAPERVRNVAIIAHVDHGKSSVADALLAGKLRKERAGDVRALDSGEEARRGITIASSVVSLEIDELTVNLVDSPGHADFNAEVAAALRVVDGAYIVVDVVEGVCVQTEAVIRQAIDAKVTLGLVLNKVDRLFLEQRLDADAAAKRIHQVLIDVKIHGVELSSVVFGSAKAGWMVSKASLDRLGIKKRFGALKRLARAHQVALDGGSVDAVRAVFLNQSSDQHQEGLKVSEVLRAALSDLLPAADALVDLARALPSPIDAAEAKAHRLLNSEEDDEETTKKHVFFDAIRGARADGPVMVLLAKRVVTKHQQLVAVGRVFAGEIHKGTELYGTEKRRVVKGLVRFGVKNVHNVRKAGPGDVVGILGVDDDQDDLPLTLSSDPTAPALAAVAATTAAPVVRYAVQMPGGGKDRLTKALRLLEMTDASVRWSIKGNETILACASSLHASVCVAKLKELTGKTVDLTSASVPFKETVSSASMGPYNGGSVLAKTTNKLNRVYATAGPLDESEQLAADLEALDLATVSLEEQRRIFGKHGWTKATTRKIWAVTGSCVLLDATTQIGNVDDLKDAAAVAFEDLCRRGPLAGEPLARVRFEVTDALIHSVAAQRKGLELAAKRALTAAFLTANPGLLEPRFAADVSAPHASLRRITDVIRDRDGNVLDCINDGDTLRLSADIPVCETTETTEGRPDLTDAIRQASSARGRVACRFSHWAPVRNRGLQRETDLLTTIRRSRNLSVPNPHTFMDRL